MARIRPLFAPFPRLNPTGVRTSESAIGSRETQAETRRPRSVPNAQTLLRRTRQNGPRARESRKIFPKTLFSRDSDGVNRLEGESFARGQEPDSTFGIRSRKGQGKRRPLQKRMVFQSYGAIMRETSERGDTTDFNTTVKTEDP